MAVIKYNEKEKDILARLMRAEAEAEGSLGMLMVGNVAINRILANCLTFKDITNIEDMAFQNPGGFEAVRLPYFYNRARPIDLQLAQRVINGERFAPATNALWFYGTYDEFCKPTWFDQKLAGKYKSHCFYEPSPEECPEIFDYPQD